MTKHFIKVRNTYQSKNKAQATALTVMKDVDQTLHASMEAARQHIADKYNEAVALCPGKIKPPPLSNKFDRHDDKGGTASISELIYIDIYEVKPLKK